MDLLDSWPSSEILGDRQPVSRLAVAASPILQQEEFDKLVAEDLQNEFDEASSSDVHPWQSPLSSNAESSSDGSPTKLLLQTIDQLLLEDLSPTSLFPLEAISPKPIKVETPISKGLHDLLPSSTVPKSLVPVVANEKSLVPVATNKSLLLDLRSDDINDAVVEPSTGFSPPKKKLKIEQDVSTTHQQKGIDEWAKVLTAKDKEQIFEDASKVQSHRSSVSKGKKKTLPLIMLGDALHPLPPAPPKRKDAERKKKRYREGHPACKEYRSSMLSQKQKEMVKRRLSLFNSEPRKRLANNTITFFQREMPEVGNFLVLSTILKWIDEVRSDPSPPKPPVKRSVLTLEQETELAALFLKMAKAGSPMNTNLGKSVTQGWVKSKGLDSLFDTWGVSDTWMLNFFKRHNLVERKGNHDAQTLPLNWSLLTDRMSYQLADLVSTYQIPPQLVFAADQMGINLLATTAKTRITRGTRSVGTIGADDKRQITAMPVVSASGDIIVTQLIFVGKSNRCHPEETHPELLYSHSKSHWTTVQTQKEVVDHVAKKVLEIKKALNRPAKQVWVWITDVFAVHTSQAFLDWFKEKHPTGRLIFVPAGCTSVSQVGDLVVNKTFKSIVRNASMNWIAQKIAQTIVNEQLPQVDVKMSVLKPLLVGWILKAVDHFKSAEGRSLIISGFKQSKLMSAFNVTFQNKVAEMDTKEIWNFSSEASSDAENIVDDSDEVEIIDLDFEEETGQERAFAAFISRNRTRPPSTDFIDQRSAHDIPTEDWGPSMAPKNFARSLENLPPRRPSATSPSLGMRAEAVDLTGFPEVVDLTD